ncbi:MAG: DUF4105 domain-containing protein [Patescibacteria group bacterium]
MNATLKKAVTAAAITLLLAIGIGLALLLMEQPRNDRAWDEGFSRLVTIETGPEGVMTFHEVRDFTYESTEQVQREWKSVTIDPRDITDAWFYLNSFSAFEQVGHTFISFSLKDGSTIAFSIEARREASEDYTFIGGFLRQYELQYLWGMERDFITERIVYRRQPLEMYRLDISPEDSQALFRSFAEETNALNAEPRFYHTLVANCTNLLAKMTNTHYPGTLPYDISWNLTGLSVRYLMREGYIQPTDQADADLAPSLEEISENASLPAPEFSAMVRSLLWK